MLDPAECGPAFLGLPQDVQAEAYDYPARFFEPTVHEVPRPRPRPRAARGRCAAPFGPRRRRSSWRAAGSTTRWPRTSSPGSSRRTPCRSSRPSPASRAFRPTHPRYVGPIGVTGSDAANRLAADADLVLAVGTRLQDFTTGSWTVFRNEALRIVAINAARFDAVKHLALPVVGDAREALGELDALVADVGGARVVGGAGGRRGGRPPPAGREGDDGRQRLRACRPTPR